MNDKELAHELLREMEEWKKDVRPEIKVWPHGGGRKVNESFNAGLSAAQEIIRKRFGITD